MNRNTKTFGFTLIELLIVMTIIGVLAGLSMFAMQGARKQGRDAKRKADLEVIRSSLELYRADCNLYPNSPLGTSITGTCPTNNTYLEKVPKDPAGSDYIYRRITNYTYELCATLEDPPTPTTSCSGGGNYKVVNP